MKNKFFSFLYVLIVVLFSVPGFATGEPLGCDVGYYDNNGICKKCPSGATTESAGATSIDDCECKKGFGYNGSGECIRCPMHKYKPTVGNYRCIYCPAGEYTNSVGSSLCKACSVGHCCVRGEQYKCKRGTYAENLSSACKRVIEHTEAVQDGVCYAKGGGGMCTQTILEDLSVYDKGMCTSCNPGCTTEGEASNSGNDCVVKTANKFCVGNSNCFSWPTEIAQQPLAIDSGNSFNCPAGVRGQ